MEARWGTPARELPPGHPAWPLEAHYLALGLATWVCTLSPQRIILGGGVMQQPHLFDLIREELLRLLNGYIQIEEVTGSLDRFIIPPRLGSRAGVLGALVLAERVCTSQGENA
jgi:fructokinase